MNQAQGPITATENTTKNTHNVIADCVFRHPGVRRVLDIPCGEGAFTERCLKHGLEVTSADCENFCRIPGANFAVADMNQRLPFADDFFDAVVCIDGIEHIERPFDFVLECRRITRPGGIVILSTPNITALRSRWRWLLTGFHNKCRSPLDEKNPNPLHHINMTSFPEMRYMLHRSDFSVTDIKTNRYKLLSLAYAPLALPSYLATARVLSKEEDPGQRRRNAEILRQLYCKELLFGETMIVVARNEKRRSELAAA